jgi:hypothetical protein
MARRSKRNLAISPLRAAAQHLPWRLGEEEEYPLRQNLKRAGKNSLPLVKSSEWVDLRPESI